MSVLYIVLPLALLLVCGALGAYAWAARSGQFDDLVTPAWRVLFDDEVGRCGSPPSGPVPGAGGGAFAGGAGVGYTEGAHVRVQARVPRQQAAGGRHRR
jgi:cbb3-type cytochrome oxidase maturation protein